MSSENQQRKTEPAIEALVLKPDELIAWFSLAVQSIVDPNTLTLLRQNLIAAIAESAGEFSKPKDLGAWGLLVLESADTIEPTLIDQASEIYKQEIENARRKLNPSQD